jgi:RNA polymerase sigma-70 factor (ECF subfamily)
MQRGLGGGAAAHRELLMELAVSLRAFYARRVGGDASDVEDLVQETLIAVHVRRESYDPSRPFLTWAFAIARYKLADHFRRRGLRRAAPIEEAEQVLAEDETEAALAAADLERLMRELTVKQREVIRYVKLEGLSVNEAAERSGLSIANVKVSVHRGLSRLKALVRGGKTDADG